MIKYLFNHPDCSIIRVKAYVNTLKALTSKGAKKISKWIKGENDMSQKVLPHHHEGDKESLELRNTLSKVDYFQIVAELFKQLGDTTRIRIFWLLCHTEECVINISAMMEMSSPAVSHHLRPLRNSGLITSHRIGKEVYYKASNTEQSRLLHQMIEKVMKITCPD